MKKIIKSICSVLLVVLLAACSTPQNIAYFQDVVDKSAVTLQTEKVFRLRPEDKVNIVVNSKDPSLEQLFTLTAPSTRNIIGASTTPNTVAGKSSGGSSQQTIAYTVDSNGYIDFPVIGTIKAEGLTRQELASTIKQALIGRQLVLDPIVTVEYVNMSVSVLGEVNRPGRQEITRDKFTLLDAISQAGDLTINGQRENVKILRKVNGEMQCYTVNLCSTYDITASPAYYLQQDDVVYITPNDKRLRESTTTGNTVLTPSFWISVASLLTTVTALVLANTK